MEEELLELVSSERHNAMQRNATRRLRLRVSGPLAVLCQKQANPAVCAAAFVCVVSYLECVFISPVFCARARRQLPEQLEEGSVWVDVLDRYFGDTHMKRDAADSAKGGGTSNARNTAAANASAEAAAAGGGADGNGAATATATVPSDEQQRHGREQAAVDQQARAWQD